MKKKTTYKEFLALDGCVDNIDEIFDAVRRSERPDTFAGVPVPMDLNYITYGQFIELCDMGEDIFTGAPKLLLNIKRVDHLQYSDVLRFAFWVTEELTRIANLFKSTSVEPTEDEKLAGVDGLNFGVFGVIDWYAQRMRIRHEDVENENWMLIYKCLDIEAKRARFNRRLREVMDRRNKK